MPDRSRSPEEIKRSFENAKKVMAQQKKKEREVDVRWAKGALFIIGVFQILVATYYANKGFDLSVLSIDFGIGGLFIALSFHANKKPVQAITIGIAAYLGLIFISALLFQTNPFSGILVKVIIISTLVSGLKSAKKLPIKKETNSDLLDDDLDDSI